MYSVITVKGTKCTVEHTGMTTTGAMKAGHGSTAVPPYQWAKDMEGGIAVPTTTVPGMVMASPGVSLITMTTAILIMTALNVMMMAPRMAA